MSGKEVAISAPREVVQVQVKAKSGDMVTASVPADLAESYPALGNIEELSELIEEVFEGREASFSVTDLRRAKVPDGNTKAFTIDDDVEKEIVGIMIVRQPRRNYWEKSLQDGGGNQAPDCHSRDGVNGVGLYQIGSEGNPTGECVTCPLSQWNEVDGKRVPPPCKPQEAVLFLTEGSPFPLLLTVPRTSQKALSDYVKRHLLMKLMRSPVEVVTRVTLQQEKNDDNLVYNVLKFEMVRDITEGMSRAEKGSYKAAPLSLGEEFKRILVSVDTSRDTEEPGRRNAGDPDREGGYTMPPPAPVDDEIDAYANAGVE